MSETLVHTPSFIKKRDVTLAKGLGIFLVVVGHLLSNGSSAGNQWFMDVRGFIYHFHMAFFMYLSGYVFFRLGRLDKLWQRYGSFVAGYTKRLLVPFMVMGLGVLCLKFLSARFFHVDNMPDDFGTGLRDLFWSTDQSPSRFIWYVFALYVFGLVSVPLYRLLWGRLSFLFGLALLLFFVPSFPYFYISKLTGYFVFFVVGGVLRFHEEAYERCLDKAWLLFMALFIGVSAMRYAIPVPPPWSFLLIGATSLPALHGLCRVLARFSTPVSRTFEALGETCYTIYLLNTLVIGVSKALLFKVSDWDGANFLWMAPLLVFLGCALPWLLESKVLMRYAWIRTTLLGKTSS